MQKQVIGLTGGIATGKSSVAKIFKQHGIKVIDCDVLARQVVRPGQQGLIDIKNEFGATVLHKNGRLNRKKLAAIIFADARKRQLLEKILHPHILHLLSQKIKANPDPLCVVDIPLLFEAGLQNWVNKIVFVTTNPQTQLQRLIARDKISAAQAQKKIAAQWPLSKKEKLSDFVINNNATRQQTRQQTLQIIQQLRK